MSFSAQAAQFVAKDCPKTLALSAARGAVPLNVGELLQVLFVLIARRNDPELVTEAVKTLRQIPAAVLAPVLRNPELHPRLFDLVAKLRLADKTVIEALLSNPTVEDDTLVYLGAKGSAEIVELLAINDERLIAAPAIVEALCGNPNSSRTLRLRFSAQVPSALELPEQNVEVRELEDEAFDDQELDDAPALTDEIEEDDTLSKSGMILVMTIPEKIKMAITGDKEWRTLMLRDSNKLVSTAALKNPRITDPEVLMVVKNRSASDELIRIITQNREWVKNQEIKKALIEHPKTPVPLAIRWMSFLNDKEIKNLAKSRNVAQAISTQARRMVMTKMKS